MKNNAALLCTLLVLLIYILSCKKNEGTEPDCFSKDVTTRQIVNKKATIKSTGGRFYLVEQGAIDTKLEPCVLAREFQIDNLQVVISGNVKARVQGRLEPCCTENIVITSITK